MKMFSLPTFKLFDTREEPKLNFGANVLLFSAYTVPAIHCLCYFRIKLFSLSITENIPPGSMLEQNLRYGIILNDVKQAENMKKRQDMKKYIRIARLTGVDSRLASDFVH